MALCDQLICCCDKREAVFAIAIAAGDSINTNLLSVDRLWKFCMGNSREVLNNGYILEGGAWGLSKLS